MKKLLKISLITLSILVIWALVFIYSLGSEVSYTGLSLEQGQMLAVKNGTTLRAVDIDGQPQITTKDYRHGRLNATIIDWVISEYFIEGNKKN